MFDLSSPKRLQYGSVDFQDAGHTVTDAVCCRSVFTVNLSVVVQHECIPQAILGMDVVCQAKSGMGKTAVFVLATLQQLEPVAGQVSHAMHLALVQYQVYSDYANPHRSKFHYIEQIRIT